jgi:hypothetical protein
MLQEPGFESLSHRASRASASSGMIFLSPADVADYRRLANLNSIKYFSGKEESGEPHYL